MFSIVLSHVFFPGKEAQKREAIASVHVHCRFPSGLSTGQCTLRGARREEEDIILPLLFLPLKCFPSCAHHNHQWRVMSSWKCKRPNRWTTQPGEAPEVSVSSKITCAHFCNRWLLTMCFKINYLL